MEFVNEYLRKLLEKTVDDMLKDGITEQGLNDIDRIIELLKKNDTGIRTGFSTNLEGNVTDYTSNEDSINPVYNATRGYVNGVSLT
jgi:hypothetical protein